MHSQLLFVRRFVLPATFARQLAIFANACSATEWSPAWVAQLYKAFAFATACRRWSPVVLRLRRWSPVVLRLGGMLAREQHGENTRLGPKWLRKRFNVVCCFRDGLSFFICWSPPIPPPPSPDPSHETMSRLIVFLHPVPFSMIRCIVSLVHHAFLSTG